MRKLQTTELEILKVVHDICVKNNITYYLVGGTLLGAVRHNGFIPWDDDLDIAMPRKDYNRFLEICKDGGLGKKYFLHHTITDSDYWLPFAKVKKNNTIFDEMSYKDICTHKGIFIDVFPLDFCKKNNGIIYHIKAKIIKKISYIIQMRVINITTVDKITLLLFKLTKKVSIKSLSLFRDKLASTCKNGKYVINYGSNYDYIKQTMEVEYYEPAKLITFEGEQFYSPSKYIKYLERLFKDWKKLPPEEERRNHNPSGVIFDTTKEG